MSDAHGWYWDVFVGIGLIGGGAALIATTKDDSPNRKTLKGFGIFFIVLGSIAFAYGLLKKYILSAGNSANDGYTENPLYENQQVQNAVIGEPNAIQAFPVEQPNRTNNRTVAIPNNRRTNSRQPVQ